MVGDVVIVINDKIVGIFEIVSGSVIDDGGIEIINGGSFYVKCCFNLCIEFDWY